MTDFAAGRGVLATWRPYERAVHEVLRKLRLDWEVAFNENALMVLPRGVDKLTAVRVPHQNARRRVRDQSTTFVTPEWDRWHEFTSNPRAA